MARYLITGGAGFIGSHLIDRLKTEGDVVVLDDFSTGQRTRIPEGVCLIEGDVADEACVARACEGVEVVFHQAAIPSVPRSLAEPLRTHRATATGTLVLLDAARQQGVRRVVFAASSSAYGGCVEEGARRVDMTPAPLSPYAAAKLAGEHYCQAYTASFGLETVRLRYFNIFGPRQDPDSPYSAVLPRWTRALMEGQAPIIYGDGLQTRDFTHVSDAVEANWLAAHAPAASGKVYNVGRGEETSLLSMLDMLREICGVQLEPSFEPARAGDARRSLADISEARADLGYAPSMSLRDGLADLVTHMQAQASA